MKQDISIRVKLDPKQYRRFVNFDNFKRQRRYFIPLLVSVIMITLCVIDLLLDPGASGTTAGLLLGLGLAVPMVCFGLYAVQVESQIAAQKLKEMPEVYELKFLEEGISVTAATQQRNWVDVPWDRLWAAFRRSDVTYLYVNAGRALILPDGQATISGGELWEYIQAHMKSGSCRVV